MVSVREAIVVEGRYDRNTVSQIVDAAIFQTDGFHIMKDKEQLALLRSVAIKKGLIIFTDADGAGFVIRNYLKGAIPAQYLKHAYTPDIMGKERRKDKPGKEGKLGVEGMNSQIILDALRQAGATFLDRDECVFRGEITKVDFAELGLSGGPQSSFKRMQLLGALNLPERMSANAMLQAVNILFTRNEFYEYVKAHITRCSDD